MKKFTKIAQVVTKVIEISHWIALGLIALSTIFCMVAPQWMKYVVEFEVEGGNLVELDAYGFEVISKFKDGQIHRLTYSLYGIGAVSIFAMVALIFNNLHEILCISEKETPFNDKNIKRLKRIGLFSILIPIIGLFMGTIIRICVGNEASEISNSMDGFIMGIIVLCLTEIFTYGASLEKDIDGLV